MSFNNHNQVSLKGNMAADPIHVVSDNGCVTFFKVATNHIKWVKNEAGAPEKKETVQFHACKAFGKLAEQIAQKLVKGDHIMIEGWLEEDDQPITFSGKRGGTQVVVKFNGVERKLWETITTTVATNVFLTLECVDEVAQFEASETQGQGEVIDAGGEIVNS